MKTKNPRFVSINSTDVNRTVIAVVLAIVFQLWSVCGKTQTAYWLESMTNTVKKESVAAPPVQAADATVLSYANIPLYIFEDDRNGYVYWSDAGTGSIKRVGISNGLVENVVTGIVGVGVYPRGIYVDVTSHRLYWAETAPKVKDVIKKIDISGVLPKSAASGTKVVTAIDIVRGITLDTVAKLIYFADAGKGGSGKGIYRASIVGSYTEAASTKVSATSGSSQPNSFFIDRKKNFIYWSDYAAAGKIQRAATDAATYPVNGKIVYTGASIRGISIDLRSNEIYWTEYPSLTIRKGSLASIPIINATEVVIGLSVLPRNLQFTPPLCATPADLSTTNISSTKATLNWGLVAAATKYIAEYRVAGTSTWISKNATSSPTILKNLTPSTTYKWRIRTVCSTDTSGYSAIQTFVTTSAAMAQNSATNRQLNASSLSLYPNPAQHTFTAELKLNEPATGKATIQLVNSQGSTVYSIDAAVYHGELKKQVNTSSALVPGYYLVRIIINDDVFADKLIIQQ